MKRKLITFLIIMVVMIMAMSSVVFAKKINTTITIDPVAAGATNEITGRILGRIQVIGSIISVVALIVIGIRYMLSSVQEKANLKGVLIYYIIGAVLVFATSNVLSIVYNIINPLQI